MSLQFGKEYINDYGKVQFSNTFDLYGQLLVPTKKFNKLTIEIKIFDEKIIELLKENGIKFYNNIAYIELKSENERDLDMDDIKVCIKKFSNLKSETFYKLVHNPIRDEI